MTLGLFLIAWFLIAAVLGPLIGKIIKVMGE